MTVFKDLVESAEEERRSERSLVALVALGAKIEGPRRSFLAAHIARHNARQLDVDVEDLEAWTLAKRRR